jgi:Poxvirus Late Transcription Factor VLTF3 like
MAGTVETLHHKFISKLNTLEDLGLYVHETVISYEQSEYISNTEVKETPKVTNYTKYMEMTIKNRVQSEIIDNSRSKMDKLVIQTARLKAIYNTGVTPILSKYYNEEDSQELHRQYRTLVTSENILDQMDWIIYEIKALVKQLQKTKFKLFIKNHVKAQSLIYCEDGLDDVLQALQGFAEVSEGEPDDVESTYSDFYNIVQTFYEQYEQIKPHLPIEKEVIDICDDCKGKMTIFQDTSELRCDDCGNIVTLEGTVFEDNQFYTQQGQCSKHKKYDARRHCKKWMDQNQAKENKTFPEEDIESLNKKAQLYYTRNGKLRSMRGMKCKQMREWLKELSLTKYNQNTPLLRKIITSQNGKAIIPPQLKYDEEQKILVLFSRAMDVYDQLMEEKVTNTSKKRRNNKPYYPYVLFKILCIVLKPGMRLRGLIECIHLQSDTTLKNHDIVWKQICKRLQEQGEKNFVYKPTDRTILIDVF